MKTSILIYLFSIVVPFVYCGNILFIAPQGSKSHKQFFSPIIDALAENGHKITFLTPYKSKKIVDNVEEILFPENSIDNMETDVFKKGVVQMGMNNLYKIQEDCIKSLKSDKVQQLYNRTFDVVFMSIVGCDCYNALLHHLKVPAIYVSPLAIISTMAGRMGLPFFPSIVPQIFLGSTALPLTFFQRLLGTVFDLFLVTFTDYYYTQKFQKLCTDQGLCPPDMPSFYEMNYNYSLIIINSVKTMERPIRPSIPSIIHAGGIHCKPHMPLNKELDDWIGGAGDHGVILFSLGSIMQPKTIPKQYQDIFVEVFRSIKQRVIWKWDEPIDNLPKNVKLMDWLPQQDIIGDSRVKLFMSHGGLLSSQEAFYHGVPVLGFPIFADQTNNLKEIEGIGVGKKLDWSELTTDKLNDTIHEMLNDQKMMDLVKLRSKIMKDLPLSQKDEVVYWVEYLMRYNGAPHLESPIRKMTWYQLYNADVWAFVTLLLVVILLIIIKLFKCCLSCCVSGSKRKLKKKLT